MTTRPAPDAVFNQVPALEGYDLAAHDAPLLGAWHAFTDGADANALHAWGARLGKAEVLAMGDDANRYEPELETYDRVGHRVDRVRFHPSYHALMRLSVEQGLHALPWEDGAPPSAHVRRAAFMHLRHQVEQGTSCPITMTFAVVPSLQRQADVAAEWLPKVQVRAYDPRLAPAANKAGVLFGMAMTERQGGSDVRANTTRAQALGDGTPGTPYALSGHKWFCSAPMCDAFLVLAQAEAGLSCFLVPRFLPDGTQNRFLLQRLKRKLGNRSNASSEVVFDNTYGVLIGAPGRGVSTILEMVRHTRLDCAVGAASLIRRCTAEALHHARHRSAFGKRLVDQPLMRRVLTDLCLESEAATLLALRLAKAFDDADRDEGAAALVRIVTPIAKYWCTQRETPVAREALECLGGNGFIEESPLPRLFRESPLNSVWEGAGNVQCLDVLRALGREPLAAPALFSLLDARTGEDPRYDAWLTRCKAHFDDPATLEVRARRVVEDLGLALQAALLLEHAPASVADAFVATRLGPRGRGFGTYDASVDEQALLDRAMPLVG